jgi:hypothetical protein
MIVIINEKVCEYVSDYPTGWKRSKSEFKFPVFIEDREKTNKYKCFIKRFNQPIEQISGWKLLESLINRQQVYDDNVLPIPYNEPNLPKVHDWVNAGENINYVFFKFIEGETLNKLLADHVEIDLEKLADGLLAAFESINKHGFWFADFFEKNMCIDSKGNVFLVDLDSAQPIANAPDNKMWGDKEYWGLVVDFYRDVLHKPKFTHSHLHGAFLNYLQVIFLILRIKKFNSQKEKENNEIKDYNEIVVRPSDLDEVSPQFRQIFNKGLEGKYPEDAKNIIAEIKILIKEKIINGLIDDGPVIKRFTLNNNLSEVRVGLVVKNREAFTLNWEVRNAADIQLYRNGQFFKKIGLDEQSIEFTEEVYDREEKNIEFELVASKSGKVVRESLSVLVQGIEEEPTMTFEVTGYSEKNGNNYVVESEKKYKLSWSVENAENIKVYRNGLLFNDVSSTKSELELTEKVYDDKVAVIEYRLDASNRSITASKSLTVTVQEAPTPIIVNFFPTSQVEKNGEDYYKVNSAKPFKIQWQVKNATRITLYKNENFYNAYNPAENEIELTEEVYDGKEKVIEFKLTAENDSKKVVSRSFRLRVREPKKPNPIPIIVGIIFIAIITTFIYKIISRDRAVSIVYPYTTKGSIFENDTLYIAGKNLPPGNDAIKVMFNNNAGKIIGLVKDNITVLVPRLDTNVATIRVKINDNTFEPQNISYRILHDTNTTTHPPTPTDTPVINRFKSSIIKEGEIITITGRNIPIDHRSVRVTFNDISGKIFEQSPERVRVQVPRLEEGVKYTLNFYVNRKSFLRSQNLRYIKAPIPPTVNDLSRNQITEGESITITGTNLPEDPSHTRVVFNNSNGKILRQTSNTIEVRVPALQEGVNTVRVTVFINNAMFNIAQRVIYRKPARPPEPTFLYPFNQTIITADEVITIIGRNIPTQKGSVQVTFRGNIVFPVIEQTNGYIKAKVIGVPQGISKGVIAVKVNGNYITLKNSLVTYE